MQESEFANDSKSVENPTKLNSIMRASKEAIFEAEDTVHQLKNGHRVFDEKGVDVNT